MFCSFEEGSNSIQDGLSTAEKIEKKRLGMMKDIGNKKSKHERKELPALLPVHITENVSGHLMNNISINAIVLTQFNFLH